MECHMSFGHPLFIFAGGVHTLQVWPKNQNDYPLLTGGQEGWSQSYGSCGGKGKSMVPVGSWEGKNGVTLPCAFKLACLYQGFSVCKAPLKTLFDQVIYMCHSRIWWICGTWGDDQQNIRLSDTRLPPVFLPISLCTCNSFWILRPYQAVAKHVGKLEHQESGSPIGKTMCRPTCWETFGSPAFVGMDFFPEESPAGVLSVL